MLISTTERIAGYDVSETLGEVFGITVRSRGVVGNFFAGLKSIVGGEITQYTAMLSKAREHAIERMCDEAKNKGADAVVMMRFDSSEIGQQMSEVVAYGTAVKLRRSG
ncbi:MAG TPA: heavy metal-binding domain-containing protein [Candidatus Cybelea sp.]|nr:heavy metal-binding domain-containing protein [Candidatus Cybelea sp.]